VVRLDSYETVGNIYGDGNASSDGYHKIIKEHTWILYSGVFFDDFVVLELSLQNEIKRIRGDNSATYAW
jgi:hypothetical protein